MAPQPRDPASVHAGRADSPDPAAWPSNASTPRRSADTASLPALQTNTGHQRTPTPSSLQQSDAASSRPKDFEGEVATDDALPSVETVRTLQDHLVLDKEGKTRTFRSLYNGKNSARRVLVIFIRHFFCGVRQPLPSFPTTPNPDRSHWAPPSLHLSTSPN